MSKLNNYLKAKHELNLQPPVTVSKTSSFAEVTMRDEFVGKEFKMDTKTGEITNTKCILKDIAKGENLFATTVRSVDEMQELITDRGRANLVVFNDLDRYHQESIVANVLRQCDRMSKAQYANLKILIKLVDYTNIILISKAKLAKALKVDDNRLTRKLNQIKPYIQVVTEGIRKGEIKIVVQPSLIFKCRKEDICLRQIAVTAYYKSINKVDFMALPTRKQLLEAEAIKTGKKPKESFVMSEEMIEDIDLMAPEFPKQHEDTVAVDGYNPNSDIERLLRYVPNKVNPHL